MMWPLNERLSSSRSEWCVDLGAEMKNGLERPVLFGVLAEAVRG